MGFSNLSLAFPPVFLNPSKLGDCVLAVEHQVGVDVGDRRENEFAQVELWQVELKLWQELRVVDRWHQVDKVSSHYQAKLIRFLILLFTPVNLKVINQ